MELGRVHFLAILLSIREFKFRIHVIILTTT